MRWMFFIMILMFLMIVAPFGGLWHIWFSPIIGGGARESYLYPIYGGIILLSGIICGATAIIIDEIRMLRNDLKKNNKTQDEDKEDKEVRAER